MMFGLKRLCRVIKWAFRYPVWDKKPLPPGVGVRPLTEGYKVKGGTNPFPSQITKRPPPPAPIYHQK